MAESRHDVARYTSNRHINIETQNPSCLFLPFLFLQIGARTHHEVDSFGVLTQTTSACMEDEKHARDNSLKTVLQTKEFHQRQFLILPHVKHAYDRQTMKKPSKNTFSLHHMPVGELKTRQPFTQHRPTRAATDRVRKPSFLGFCVFHAPPLANTPTCSYHPSSAFL